MVAFLYGGAAFAQLNESDTASIQLRAGVAGSWQQGNVELLVVRGRLEFVSNGNKKVVFKSQINSLYQEFSSNKADNDIYSRNFLYWNPQARAYPFLMVFFQTNFRRKIDYRVFGGAGATWQLIRNQNNIVKVSGSLVKENTRFSVNQYSESYYNGTEHISVWRSTLYLSGVHKVEKSNLKIFYNGYWQPALDEVPNNRFQADVGAEMPLRKGLNFQIEYILNYEQVAADEVKQTDRILTFGINYQIRR